MASVEEIIERLEEGGLLEGRLQLDESDELPPWMPHESRPHLEEDYRPPGVIQLTPHHDVRFDDIHDPDTDFGGFLGRDLRQRIGDEVSQQGVEALAWYLPFHTSVSSWGIYLRESGIVYVADFLARNGVGPHPSVDQSRRFLELHEAMHFHVEAVSSQQELACGTSLYLNRKNLPQGNLVLSPRHVEEALCNAEAIRRSSPDARDPLEDFARNHQPAGYRDWERVGWRSDFQQGVQDFHSAVGRGGGLQPALWYALLTWSRNRYRASDVPIYLVRDFPAPTGLSYAFSHAGFEISIHFAKEHAPPHFHADHKRWRAERRYQYPSFDPAPPTQEGLSNKEERRLNEAIDAYPRQKFEEEFERHRSIVQDKYDPLHGTKVP